MSSVYDADVKWKRVSGVVCLCGVDGHIQLHINHVNSLYPYHTLTVDSLDSLRLLVVSRGSVKDQHVQLKTQLIMQ